MQRISPEGEIEVINRFLSGNAHVVHGDGFLYVTARTDHRVYRYQIATGDVVTVAGTVDQGFDDGPGNAATIARPNAIAVGARRCAVHTTTGAARAATIRLDPQDHPPLTSQPKGSGAQIWCVPTLSSGALMLRVPGHGSSSTDTSAPSSRVLHIRLRK